MGERRSSQRSSQRSPYPLTTPQHFYRKPLRLSVRFHPRIVDWIEDQQRVFCRQGAESETPVLYECLFFRQHQQLPLFVFNHSCLLFSLLSCVSSSSSQEETQEELMKSMSLFWPHRAQQREPPFILHTVCTGFRLQADRGK